MLTNNWHNLDSQMEQCRSYLVNKLKIPEEKTGKIASVIAAEIQKIPIEERKKIADDLFMHVSIDDRLDELKAFQGWMDIAHSFPRNPFITRAQVIAQNYICFVYLGEACFKSLKKYLEAGSVAKKCFNFLINNPVRAFRNALAHSNWKYNDDFTGIIFWAHKGPQTDEPMDKWEVSQKELGFWQSLARCSAYVAYISLDEQIETID